MDTSRLTEAAFYAIFVCVSSGLVDKLLYKRSATAKQTLESALHHLFTAHGFLTFALMRLLEPGQAFGSDTAPTSSFAIRAVLALFLWDFGFGHGCGVRSWILLNMHHAGALIALQFQARAGEARLDTLLFGWLWAIHAFGLFAKVQSKLVALTIGKEYCASEGQRSVVLDGAKHIYSLVTVRLIYDYLNAPGQPGLGVRNYQTWAVCVMLTGRYLVNDNCRNIDFFRRVEAPGAALVFLDHLLFRDPHLDRACAILLTALAGLVTHAVFLAQHRPKPARYHGPAEHEELRDFLDEATPRVLERKQEPPSGVVAAWFATQKTARGEAFATAYPSRGTSEWRRTLCNLCFTVEERKRGGSCVVMCVTPELYIIDKLDATPGCEAVGVDNAGHWVYHQQESAVFAKVLPFIVGVLPCTALAGASAAA